MKTNQFGATLLGSILIGIGIVMSLIANLGADPLSGVYQLTASVLKQDLAIGTLVVSVTMLIITFLYSQDLIGFGTIVNPLCISLSIVLMPTMATPSHLITRVIVLLLGFTVLGFGTSLYLLGNKGTAPYDGCILALADLLKIPYGKSRMILDALFVFIVVIYFRRIEMAPFIAILFIGLMVDVFTKMLKPMFNEY